MKSYDSLLQQQIDQTIAIKKYLNIDYLLQLVDETYVHYQRYVQAVNGMQASLWDLDLINDHCHFTCEWRQSLGYSHADNFKSLDDWLTLIHSDDLNRIQNDLNAHLRGTNKYFSANHRIRCNDDTYIWVTSSGTVMRNTDNQPIRLIVTQVSHSSEKTAEQELLQAAFYDKLTNLPNRSLFINRLQQKIAKYMRPGEPAAALLYMDLDRFKIVNDSLGHDAGDELLVAVSRRIESCLRPGDTAGRIGGDEFAIILSDIDDNEQAILIANRIINQISASYFIKKHEVNVSASIGIMILDENSKSYETVIKNADNAMYQAKVAGKSQAKMYINNIKTNTVNLIQLESELKNAFIDKQLTIYYQPIVEAKNDYIEGFEALIRWEHPVRGIIQAKEFISLAEDADLIFDIATFVMQTVCDQINDWKIKFKGKSVPWVSINISARQIIDTAHMHNLIDIIDNACLESGQLILEFAENTVVNRAHHCMKIMQKFKENGAHLCLDNFGTGHASLDLLCTYPFDYLKIDQAYMIKMIGGKNDKGISLVHNIINFARQINIKTIISGVESQKEYNILKTFDNHCNQGYYFAKPMPLIDVNQLLMNQLQ